MDRGFIFIVCYIPLIALDECVVLIALKSEPQSARKKSPGNAAIMEMGGFALVGFRI